MSNTDITIADIRAVEKILKENQVHELADGAIEVRVSPEMAIWARHLMAEMGEDWDE